MNCCRPVTPRVPLGDLRWVPVLALVWAMPALAVLNTPVTVSLIAPGGATGSGFTDPTPVNASQSFSYGGVVSPSNGGNVGSLMLPGEQIFLNGDAIHISSYAGDDTGGVFSTGWLALGPDKARYEFSGLAIAGRVITGFTVSGFDGFANAGFAGAEPGTVGVSMFDTNADGSQDKLIFNLDALRFKSRPLLGSSEFHADFRIDLISTPVPEAGSLLMTLAGLSVIAAVRFKRAQGQRSAK
jgi:hypothetical protein